MQSKDHLPVRAIHQDSQDVADVMVEVATDAITDHERRMHAIEARKKLPGRRTEPVTAIPFPDWTIPDEDIAHAWEMIKQDGATLEQAALAIDVPTLVLERELARYKPPYQKYIRELADGSWGI